MTREENGSANVVELELRQSQFAVVREVAGFVPPSDSAYRYLKQDPRAEQIGYVDTRSAFLRKYGFKPEKEAYGKKLGHINGYCAKKDRLLQASRKIIDLFDEWNDVMVIEDDIVYPESFSFGEVLAGAFIRIDRFPHAKSDGRTKPTKNLYVVMSDTAIAQQSAQIMEQASSKWAHVRPDVWPYEFADGFLVSRSRSNVYFGSARGALTVL